MGNVTGSTLLALLFEHQRRMELAAGARTFPLSLFQTHLLNAVVKLDEPTPSALYKRFGCSRALISKCLNELAKLGLIVSVTVSDDKRSKIIQLTPKGKQLLNKQNELRFEMTDEVIQALTANQRVELGKLFHELANELEGDSLPVDEKAFKQHPVLPALERLSKSFGVLYGNALGTSLTPQQFHILHAIACKECTASELCIKLGFHPSKVSRSIDELNRSGLVECKVIDEDRRTRLISVSAKGQEVIGTALGKLSRLLNGAARKFDSAKLANFMERYLGSVAQTRGTLKDRFTIERITREEQRQALRIAFIEEMAKRGTLDKVPASLFPSDLSCVAVYNSQNEIVGGAMFKNAKIGERPLLAFGSHDSEEAILRLLMTNA